MQSNCLAIVLILDRKSYISLRLVPKSVTLMTFNGEMALIVHYFTEFDSFHFPGRIA